MAILPGIGLVVFIMLVAGFVAYIGDRVGHQVGRRRLTLFGLRPKYTSTIVAVATGMLIALSVTLAALIGSSYVRTAFFRIGQLNAQINQLQTQALSAERELETTRNGAFSVPRGQLVANMALTLDAAQPEADQMRELAKFFDQTVTAANQQLVKPPFLLKPYPHKASESDIQTGLRRELNAIRDQSANSRTAVLLLPVAAQNLFRGDQISFAFAHWEDKRLAYAGEVLGSVIVDGGAPLNLNTLITNASLEMARRGMPAPFLQSAGYNAPQVQTVIAQLSRLRGKYRVSAKASYDIYPHSGGVVFDFSLSPVRT